MDLENLKSLEKKYCKLTYKKSLGGSFFLSARSP